MKVYINNEEVLCNRNLVINQSLSQPSSVILNNVYPKTWENDKDYVSRFYMPKDYSPVRIINENTETKSYNLINNVRIKESRIVMSNSTYEENAIKYDKNSSISYVRVAPGYTYTIKIKNYQFLSPIAIFEADSLNIEEIPTPIGFINPMQTMTITITTSREYILFNSYEGDVRLSKILEMSVICTDNLMFSGLIKNSGNISLNPRYPHYSTLQAIDYSTLLSEGECLNYVLKEMTISQAITKLVTDQKGFMVGTIDIDNDEILAPYNCNEKTTYDVLQYLSEITGAKWFVKPISKDIVLVNFYMPSRLPTGDQINYTTEYFSENEITDIKYSYNAKDYRNKQAIVNDECKPSITQTETYSFNGSEITTLYPIYSVVSITSGTKEYSVASDVEKQAGVIADFYYDYGSNQIKGEIPTNIVLTITYYPIIVAREVAYNLDEINRISTATNRNGTISRYEKRKDTKDENALSQIAKTYIEYKGVPEIILTITSQKDLFELGTQVIFNGPLDDLKTRYLVKDKKVDMTITDTQQLVFYTYDLSSSFNDENAINFFDNQRRKLEGNLSEDEYISRFIDIPSQTNIIFYGATIEPVEIDNTTLEAELEVEL